MDRSSFVLLVIHVCLRGVLCVHICVGNSACCRGLGVMWYRF